LAAFFELSGLAVGGIGSRGTRSLCPQPKCAQTSADNIFCGVGTNYAGWGNRNPRRQRLAVTRSIVPCQQLVLPRTPRQESDHYARLSNRGRRSLGLPFSDRLSAGVLFGLGRVRIFLTLEPEPKPIHVALLRGSKHARWKHIAQVPDGSRSRSSVIGVYYLKLSTFLIALTASAANASGSLQTTLSKLPRPHGPVDPRISDSGQSR